MSLPGSRAFLPSLLLTAAVACASGPQVRDRSSEAESSSGDQAKAAPNPEQPAPAVEKPFEPKSFAHAAGTVANCEVEARNVVKTKGRDMAWAVLRECVNRGFSSIKRIADGFWVEDLLARKDAPALLTKIIASRGGDIQGDLALLNQKRISIFSLAVATEQPKTYTGRLVIARIKLEGADEKGGPMMMAGTETSIGNVTSLVKSGGMSTVSTTGGYNQHTTYQRYERRNDNDVSETGRSVLLRLQKSDPFLAPGREFVVLARFEGVRESGLTEGEDSKVAILSLVSYFEPAALVIE